MLEPEGSVLLHSNMKHISSAIKSVIFFIWATRYCIDTINFVEDKMIILLSNYAGGGIICFTSNESINFWGTDWFLSARALCMTLILSF